MLVRAALVTLALACACGRAEARSLQVGGTAGYLSEWEITATVSDGASAASGGTFSGPLTLRHTGVCAVSGPVEKSGEMNVKVSGWGPFSQVEISLRFAGTRCLYRGRLSETMSGVMDCSDAKGVPLELVVK